MKLQRQFKSKQLAKPKHRSLKELSHVMDRTSDDLMSRMRCEWNCARRAVLICQTRVTVCMLLCKRTLAIYVARLSSIMKLYLIANNSPVYYTDLQRFAGQPPPCAPGNPGNARGFHTVFCRPSLWNYSSDVPYVHQARLSCSLHDQARRRARCRRLPQSLHRNA